MENREIKFRGKRTGENNWVYGNFFYQSYYGSLVPYIGLGVQNGSIIGFQVDPETVGQYTGHKDKNGKDIYEGDEDEIGTIVYCDGAFWYDIKESVESFLLKEEVHRIAIIGNIYENPELLNQN